MSRHLLLSYHLQRKYLLRRLCGQGHKVATMALFLYFVVLFDTTDSFAKECNVANCDPNVCTNNVCTKCEGAYYQASDGSCNQCFLNCRHCGGTVCYRCVHDSCDACISNCTCSSNNIACPDCPDGYYLSGSHCNKCYYFDCKCSSLYRCTGCLPGKFGTSNHCQNSCPSNCVTCKDSNDCNECIAGKYGPSCQLNCTTICVDGTCDKISGLCVGRCADGQYIDTNNECRMCSVRCASCTDFDNCISCKRRYFWGQLCQFDCTACYENCHKDGGWTSECDAPYYKIYDGTKNGTVCIRCPENCSTCSSPTQCRTCRWGYWGSMCQHSCTGCSYNCNKINGCNAGCSRGYYQYVISGGVQCGRCPYKCALCRNDISCDECENAYYSLDGISCSDCPGNCKIEKCNKNDGLCLEGCKDDWFGLRCNESCPSNCQQCDQFCNLCKIGYYGDRCEYNCSMHCKQENGLQTCYKTNGTCIHGYRTGNCSTDCNNTCTTESQCSCQSKSTNNTTVVVLSIMLVIAVLLAAVFGIIIVLKRRQLCCKQKTCDASSNVPRGQELDNNDYQDLNRTESTDGAYSTVTHEYENAL